MKVFQVVKGIISFLLIGSIEGREHHVYMDKIDWRSPTIRQYRQRYSLYDNSDPIGDSIELTDPKDSDIKFVVSKHANSYKVSAFKDYDVSEIILQLLLVTSALSATISWGVYVLFVAVVILKTRNLSVFRSSVSEFIIHLNHQS